MTDELARLDGNAAAGPLARFFAFEATNLRVTCASCGGELALGKLHLYGGSMGMILRCPACGEVNLRALEVGPALRLDVRGAACLALGPEPARAAP
jgi:predicted RNA-binding Zn-ribbon protein involved in translation (DUF1610 family)